LGRKKKEGKQRNRIKHSVWATPEQQKKEERGPIPYVNIILGFLFVLEEPRESKDKRPFLNGKGSGADFKEGIRMDSETKISIISRNKREVENNGGKNARRGGQRLQTA